MLKYRAALGLYLALYTLRIWSVRVTRLGIIIPKSLLCSPTWSIATSTARVQSNWRQSLINVKLKIGIFPSERLGLVLVRPVWRPDEADAEQDGKCIGSVVAVSAVLEPSFMVNFAILPNCVHGKIE
jgi:hypothetical protein